MVYQSLPAGKYFAILFLSNLNTLITLLEDCERSGRYHCLLPNLLRPCCPMPKERSKKPLPKIYVFQRFFLNGLLGRSLLCSQSWIVSRPQTLAEGYWTSMIILLTGNGGDAITLFLQYTSLFMCKTYQDDSSVMLLLQFALVISYCWPFHVACVVS